AAAAALGSRAPQQNAMGHFLVERPRTFSRFGSAVRLIRVLLVCGLVLTAFSRPATASSPQACDDGDLVSTGICTHFGGESPGHRGHGGGSSGPVQNYAYFYLPS